MELLTKQVSLSLVFCLAGLGRARVTLTLHPPSRVGCDGHKWPFHSAWQGLHSMTWANG